MKNIKVAKIAELRSNKCMMTLKAIIFEVFSEGNEKK